MRAVILCLLMSSSLLRAGEPAVAEVLGLDLVLLDVVAGNVEDTERGSLAVYVRRVEGRWQTAIVLGYNSSYHLGRVAEAVVSERQITLRLAVELVKDPWIAGGTARFGITLAKQADGSWRGNHQGTFRGIAVHGATVAEVHPPYRQFRPPASLTEHPRLLFRSQDLPALQAKAKTPFGQAAFAAMQDAAGAAVKYRLTGDTAQAAEARRKVEALMADQGSGSKQVAHRVWSWRAEEVAIAFDLCHDIWPADFKAVVAAYLAKVAEHAYFNHGAFTEYIAWGLTSRHAANLLYGPALAGLAIRGEPEALTAEPPAYLGGRDPLSPLPALNAIPQGLSVVPFTDGKMPAKWLCAGPLKPAPGEDPLAAAGGPALMPVPGQALGATAWRELPEACIWQDQLDVTGANQHAYFTRNAFATVIEVDREGWFRFQAGLTDAVEDPRFYLDAVPLADGDILTVASGRHRLLIDLRMGQTNPWGKITVKPRLTRLEAAAATAALADLRQDAQDRRDAWAEERAYHQSTQGASPRFRRLFEIGEALMYAFVRHAIGDGGFQAGARNPMFNFQGPVRYAGPYRVLHGRDLSSHHDLTAFLPRMLMPMVFPVEGRPLLQSINGEASFDLNGWFEARDGAPEYFALLYPLASPAYQPALQWAWNRHVGVQGPEDVAKLFKAGGLRGGEYGPKAMDFNTFPVYAFVHYPLGQEAKPPAACLPLTWEAAGHGWYCFRNRWQDQDDAVVQIFAKARGSVEFAPENAAAWRVLALGREWVIGPRNFDEARTVESMVVLPDRFDTNRHGCGRVTWRQQEADGSGSVTIDLAQVYAASRMQGERRLPLHTGYGSVVLEKNLADSGLTGRRAFAVDFSGKSGAPVLLAVLDQVQGQAKSLWLHQLESITEAWGKWDVQGPDGTFHPPSKKGIPWQGRGRLPDGWKIVQHRDPKVPEVWKPSLPATVVIAGTAFTMTKGDASLTATFAPAAGLEVKEQVVEFLENELAGHGHGVHRVASYAVTATTPTGAYFAVMTIQRGTAPAVEVEGTGLQARFRIGERRVRWDGEKIVVE